MIDVHRLAPLTLALRLFVHFQIHDQGSLRSIKLGDVNLPAVWHRDLKLGEIYLSDLVGRRESERVEKC